MSIFQKKEAVCVLAAKNPVSKHQFTIEGLVLYTVMHFIKPVLDKENPYKMESSTSGHRNLSKREIWDCGNCSKYMEENIHYHHAVLFRMTC